MEERSLNIWFQQHHSHFMHYYYSHSTTDSYPYIPENSKKPPQNFFLNLKKISVRNFLFNIRTTSEAHSILMYKPPPHGAFSVCTPYKISKKPTRNFKSQKNPLLLYIHCHPLFANRALQNYGKADRPCALCYWPINYTLLPGLHLSCSMTGSSMVTP